MHPSASSLSFASLTSLSVARTTTPRHWAWSLWERPNAARGQHFLRYRCGLLNLTMAKGLTRCTDISIDDLASIAAAHGDDDVYLTDLTTGETFSIDQLRKKDGEEGGEQGLYAKGKLFVVGTAVGARDDSDREPGKGKSIKSLLQQVDSSVSTQKANLLKRIDSLTKGDEEGAARSPSPAPPTSPLANGLRKDEKQPSFFRKFGKDSKVCPL